MAQLQPIDLVDTILERELLFNDTTNANQLIATYGHEIRYVSGLGWMAHDGQRWVRDDNAVLAKARETMQQCLADAATIPTRNEQDAKVTHFNRSLNRRKLEDMVAVAASDSRVWATAQDFDTNPYLFNAQNVTVDLRTGKTHEHDPADMITQVAARNYNPDARSTEWEAFVLWAAGGREDLRDYLQEVAGYSLTGLVTEKCLFVLYGPEGDNGKTLYQERLANVMGDYSIPGNTGAVLSSARSGGHSADLAALAGRRMVTLSETQGGQTWDEARLKNVTGGERVTASFKHGNPFDYLPQYKIWLATNTRPLVQEGGNAVWERLKVIPFDNRAVGDGKDPKKAERLDAEGEAILAWAVEGAMRYLKRGKLVTPDCMQQVIDAYRRDYDPFAGFVTDCCESDPTAWTATGKPTSDGLLKAYDTWYSEIYGKYPDVSPQQFHDMAEHAGYRVKRRNTGYGVMGLRLKSATQPAPQDDYDGINF